MCRAVYSVLYQTAFEYFLDRETCLNVFRHFIYLVIDPWILIAVYKQDLLHIHTRYLCFRIEYNFHVVNQLSLKGSSSRSHTVSINHEVVEKLIIGLKKTIADWMNDLLFVMPFGDD